MTQTTDSRTESAGASDATTPQPNAAGPSFVYDPWAQPSNPGAQPSYQGTGYQGPGSQGAGYQGAGYRGAGYQGAQPGNPAPPAPPQVPQNEYAQVPPAF